MAGGNGTSQELVSIRSPQEGANSRHPRDRTVGTLMVLDTHTQKEQMAAHSSVPGISPSMLENCKSSRIPSEGT